MMALRWTCAARSARRSVGGASTASVRRSITEATSSTPTSAHEPWNKGKLIGQKAPLRPKEFWAIRMRLQQDQRTRELALLNLALDSKLRACDLGRFEGAGHLARRQGRGARDRAAAKTKRPVQFEITAAAREAGVDQRRRLAQ